MLTETGKCQITRAPSKNQRKAKRIYTDPAEARTNAKNAGLIKYRCQECRFWHLTGKGVRNA